MHFYILVALEVFSYEHARKRLNIKFLGGVPGNYVYEGMNTTGGCKKYKALPFYVGKQTKKIFYMSGISSY